MSAPRRLAMSWLRQQPTRTLLTAFAMAVATSLVVVTVAGYRAAATTAESFADDVLGPWQVMVTPRYAVQPVIDPSWDDRLGADSAVADVARVAVVYGDIEDVDDTTYYEAWRTAFLSTDRTQAPLALASGSWLDPNQSQAAEIIPGVVSGGLAKRWKMGVGDQAPIYVRGGQFTLSIIGITDEHLAHDVASGVWVSQADGIRLAGNGRTTDRLMLRLNGGIPEPGAVERIARLLEPASPALNVADLTSIGADLTGAKAVKRIASMGGSAAAISLLAAAFIVYATTSAGAAERTRQLAMLRTIGATRSQVLRSVLWETVFLAGLGAIGGVLLGHLWLVVLALALPQLIGLGALADPIALLTGFGGAVVAALIAGLMPAVRASRGDPLAAMSGAVEPTQPRLSRLRCVSGGALLLAAVIILIAPAPASVGIAGALLLVQMACLAIGGILCTPALLTLTNRLAAAAAARWAGIPVALLHQRLGGGRHTGTVWTLTVCLGLSVMMSIWGRTMVAPFMPSPELPEMVITIRPAGVPLTATEDIRALPELDSDRFLPLANEQTLLAPELHGRVGGKVSEATVLIWGLDPHTAFAGEDPLLPVTFDAGGAAGAIAALATPGGCLIPQDLASKLGLQLGDALPVMALDDATRTVELEIRGFASLPGWHWVTQFSGMRTLGERPQAPILTSLADTEALGIGVIRQMFAVPAAGADANAIRRAVAPIAEAHGGSYTDPRFGPAVASGTSVQVTDNRMVAQRMETRAGSVIWVLGAIPLATLLVAALGVAGAIAAGVRSRTWEFGVLRAIGLTASQAKGMVLAEAALLAVTAAILAIGLGSVAAAGAIAISLQAFGAGGSPPALAWPVIDIMIAALITLATAVLAARGSAKRLAQAEPLALLQAGRAAR